MAGDAQVLTEKGGDGAPPAPPALRAVRDPNAFAALGRSVSYMMTKPSFAKLNFGVWSRTLVGQINRKHYFLVMQGANVVGFAGWAYVDEARAIAWVEGRADFGSGDCVDGDCMVVNAWAGDNDAVNHFVRRELRKYAVGRKTIYAKRFYKDGRMRPWRIPVTEKLARHVEKGG